jgi:hypothetical protein
MPQTVYRSINDRVIGAILPEDDESPRGYLRHVAAEWNYTDFLCLVLQL